MALIYIERYDFTDIIEDADKKLVLIIYDIIDNKRRTKMVKLLESYGTRVQRSAFEALINRSQYSKIIEGIKKIISNEDNVRIYRLNSSNEMLLLGESYSVYEEEVIIV
ncbi:CRISPR-associated endonuclease Cas2 [Mogibacterium neglectum]|uniref:CRISPR-associated endonuclease Cas2 n=1 Tax=Mogibacterium neglectum TaxID=114528 RepID=UPI00272D763A|nr:CRISPR-associated endonuclease Cas2 [Mogibacterium neglectum]WLD76277.1 CRISPR-associated endonuclease Cas2 [Mogibacterium neglectum]